MTKAEVVAALQAKIDAMADLEPNWNSYGSVPISEPTRDFAKRVAAVLPEPSVGTWYVVPCAGGEIQFESENELIEVYAEAPDGGS